MDFNPKRLRKRFAELTKKHDAAREKIDPLRVEYDKLCQANRETELAASAEIKKLEAPLYDIEQERAAIARALGGKTSEPVE